MQCLAARNHTALAEFAQVGKPRAHANLGRPTSEPSALVAIGVPQCHRGTGSGTVGWWWFLTGFVQGLQQPHSGDVQKSCGVLVTGFSANIYSGLLARTGRQETSRKTLCSYHKCFPYFCTLYQSFFVLNEDGTFQCRHSDLALFKKRELCACLKAFLLPSQIKPLHILFKAM